MRNGLKVFIVVIKTAVTAGALAISSRADEKKSIAAGFLRSGSGAMSIYGIAVKSLPHTDPEQEAAAAIFLHPIAKTSAAAFKQYIKNLVTPYKYPRIVNIMNKLPNAASGRIFKRGFDPDHNDGAARFAVHENRF